MRIVTSSQMKQIEQRADQNGLFYYDMMENAGTAAANSIMSKISPRDKRVLVYAGKGNNGGDGFVVARLLFQAGAKVKVVLVDGEPVTEDAAANFDLLHDLEIGVLDFLNDEPQLQVLLRDVDIIVDAIYGTGFHGALRKTARLAARSINGAIAAVFSLDLPSGVNSDNGESDKDAVQADFTIAFDSLKPAHLIYPAAGRCGAVECAEIGIVPQWRTDLPRTFLHITPEMVMEAIPERPVDSHKGTFGKLLNISSSLGMTGAAKLSVLGAQRVGTGLVTLAAPRSLISLHAASLTEAVFLPLIENEAGTVARTAAVQLGPKLEQSSACLIGCGLSNNDDTAAVVEFVVKNAKCPLLIDADGINALGRNIDILSEAAGPVVLTPHPAELARLLNVETEDLLAHRVKYGRAFAQKYNLTLVFKGAHTLVFAPDERVFINTTGNNGLAKGGSGDLLAGMIAGLMAQGIPPLQSAMCGVWLHGAAADRCADRLSKTAMLPSDILTDLCGLFREYNR
ncbi:NAD(P)H-hydrate dehydratase [Clostridiaceae bacterium NSJ-31]|uniref:Bifunctional NAD(P)H-hydrate repair enzyme n=1 Tax=Ligaoa zhengdingensis TaxID=2763658 RepID=A0A926E0L1_9FIRM|nr:NAD(P)H-hydrate dehydratase [Ligaoa zhengdingensis]MBC8546969.1 NAD(P)H-hydrate dehydratase [Ligaoa zhengdingensis]